MVTLVKKSVSDMVREIVISDGTYIDYMTGRMDNIDILRVIGKAYSLGYRDFVLETRNYGIVAEAHDSDITINWDVVRVADKAEWYGRSA